LIDEVKVAVTGPAKQKIECICSSVLAKETLRGSDYCKGAVLMLLALEEFQPTSELTEVLRTAVEMCEILYSNPEKRTRSILPYYLALVHAKTCEQAFCIPKTMSPRKLFGRYFHALTTHSPLVNHIISPRLLNTEVEERMFGQCKAITRNRSHQQTDHIIIPNILVCIQYEQQRRETAITTVQAQDNEVPPKRNTKLLDGELSNSLSSPS
jgi:hypothetical protein